MVVPNLAADVFQNHLDRFVDLVPIQSDVVGGVQRVHGVHDVDVSRSASAGLPQCCLHRAPSRKGAAGSLAEFVARLQNGAAAVDHRSLYVPESQRLIKCPRSQVLAMKRDKVIGEGRLCPGGPIAWRLMNRLRPDCLIVPLLLIAGMVMHVTLPGFGCHVVAGSADVETLGCGASPGGSTCRMRKMAGCQQRAEARRCCRAMEQAVEQSSCCMAKKRCTTPPPPYEPEPDSPQDDCMMGSCPVKRWVVILDKTGLDDIAALQLRRVDLDAMMPVDPVVHDIPPPDPLRLAARLAHQGAWLI
jgi:hypothetical protein